MCQGLLGLTLGYSIMTFLSMGTGFSVFSKMAWLRSRSTNCVRPKWKFMKPFSVVVLITYSGSFSADAIFFAVSIGLVCIRLAILSAIDDDRSPKAFEPFNCHGQIRLRRSRMLLRRSRAAWASSAFIIEKSDSIAPIPNSFNTSNNNLTVFI